MMISVNARSCSAVIFFSVAIFIACYTHLALCNESQGSRDNNAITGASLRMKLGIYREDDKMPSYAIGFAKDRNIQQKASSSAMSRHYTALAGVSYVISVRNMGNFAAGIGYYYRMNKLGSASAKNIREKVQNESLPYAELFWEKQGILFIENMSLSISAQGLKERVGENDKTFPISLTCALRYRLGSLFVMYAGVRLPADFQSTDIKSQLYKSLRPILGIELST